MKETPTPYPLSPRKKFFGPQYDTTGVIMAQFKNKDKQVVLPIAYAERRPRFFGRKEHRERAESLGGIKAIITAKGTPTAEQVYGAAYAVAAKHNQATGNSRRGRISFLGKTDPERDAQILKSLFTAKQKKPD